MAFVFRNAVTLYQFCITVYGGQRRAQFMGDGVHRFLTGDYQLLVLMIGLSDLSNKRSGFFFVFAYSFGVSVDNYVRHYQ